jgi:hypothetical protein
MIDRLRSLLDQPLDPNAGRAVLALASAIILGFGLLVVLAGIEPSVSVRSADAPRTPAARSPKTSPAAIYLGGPDHPHRHRPQDPQDRPETGAARRATAALRAHRALQHVPYQDGGFLISLAGARNGEAVLTVTAASKAAGRRRWHAVLRKYQDEGRAYIVHFRGRGGAHG